MTCHILSQLWMAIALRKKRGVYLGKLMSGHLLSLSRCLLNCKKENRGEYLEGIFAQNIGVTIRQDSAKIANSSSSANPVICGWPVIPAKKTWGKKRKRKELPKLGPFGKGWMGGGRVEIKESGKVDWDHIENAGGAVPTQIYSSVLELVHWMATTASA